MEATIITTAVLISSLALIVHLIGSIRQDIDDDELFSRRLHEFAEREE